MNFASVIRRLRKLSWPLRWSNGLPPLGARGEDAAAKYLKRKGHRIIAHNYQAPVGEVDLISTDGETIVFIEVKTRASQEAEDLARAVRKPQWARIERAARYFLMERSAQHRPCRFDLVAIVWPHRGSPQIEHFEDVYRPRHP